MDIFRYSQIFIDMSNSRVCMELHVCMVRPRRGSLVALSATAARLPLALSSIATYRGYNNAWLTPVHRRQVHARCPRSDAAWHANY